MGKLNRHSSITHFSHPHPLELCDLNDLSNNRSPSSSSVCSACCLPHSSGGCIYACRSCPRFSLHFHCSQMPPSITHPSHPHHPLSLAPVLNYPAGKFICKACKLQSGGFSYHCATCGFYLDMKCAIKPMVMNHHLHPHPLDLTFAHPYGDGAGFSCDVCAREVTSPWFYRCAGCGFDLHLDCTAVACAATQASTVNNDHGSSGQMNNSAAAAPAANQSRRKKIMDSMLNGFVSRMEMVQQYGQFFGQNDSNEGAGDGTGEHASTAAVSGESFAQNELGEGEGEDAVVEGSDADNSMADQTNNSTAAPEENRSRRKKIMNSMLNGFVSRMEMVQQYGQFFSRNESNEGVGDGTGEHATAGVSGESFVQNHELNEGEAREGEGVCAGAGAGAGAGTGTSTSTGEHASAGVPGMTQQFGQFLVQNDQFGEGEGEDAVVEGSDADNSMADQTNNSTAAPEENRSRRKKIMNSMLNGFVSRMEMVQQYGQFFSRNESNEGAGDDTGEHATAGVSGESFVQNHELNKGEAHEGEGVCAGAGTSTGEHASAGVPGMTQQFGQFLVQNDQLGEGEGDVHYDDHDHDEDEDEDEDDDDGLGAVVEGFQDEDEDAVVEGSDVDNSMTDQTNNSTAAPEENRSRRKKIMNSMLNGFVSRMEMVQQYGQIFSRNESNEGVGDGTGEHATAGVSGESFVQNHELKEGEAREGAGAGASASNGTSTGEHASAGVSGMTQQFGQFLVQNDQLGEGDGNGAVVEGFEDEDEDEDDDHDDDDDDGDGVEGSVAGQMNNSTTTPVANRSRRKRIMESMVVIVSEGSSYLELF